MIILITIKDYKLKAHIMPLYKKGTESLFQQIEFELILRTLLISFEIYSLINFNRYIL